MKDPAEKKYTLAVGAYRFLFHMYDHHFILFQPPVQNCRNNWHMHTTLVRHIENEATCTLELGAETTMGNRTSLNAFEKRKNDC